MTSARFKHVIFTRFGIGVQRAAFHERRLAIMKASLLPCIAAQTNPDVHWLLVTDSRAPEHIRAALEELRGSVPNLFLRTVDPLSEYSLSGFKREFIDEIVGDDEIVFLSRVDDDDAINRRFSEIVVAFLSEQLAAGASLPIAASWTHGLELYIGENKGQTVHMPWLAPSIGVATRMADFFNPMTTHWSVGKRAVASGGVAHDIEDQVPMWAWLKHQESDSSEFRQTRHEIRRLPSADGLQMSGFPFDPQKLTEAYAKTAKDRPPEPELVDGVPAGRTRLEIKHHLLQALQVIDRASAEARTNGDKALGSLTASSAALASLFYSL
jgi:hypothetical protein